MGQKKSLPAWRYKQEEDPLVKQAQTRYSHVDVVAMAEAEAACERWCVRLKPCDRSCAWDDDAYDWDYDIERSTAEWIAAEAFVYFDQLARTMRTATVDKNGRDARNYVYPGHELLVLKDAEYRARWEKAGGGETGHVMTRLCPLPA